MSKELTEKQIQKIKERLDYWNKTEITKKNFNKVAFELLGVAIWGNPEFPKCGARFTADEGYSEGGGFRSRDKRNAIWANLIMDIDDEKLKKQLWKKFVSVVRKLYKVSGRISLLGRAGDLERLVNETKKRVQSTKQDIIKHGFGISMCFGEIGYLVYNMVLHKDKLEFIKNPQRLTEIVESLIIQVVELATPEELEREYYELEDYIKFCIAYEEPIPPQLKGAAQYILNKNKEEVERERQRFEEREQQLKEYSTAIRKALRTKKG